MSQVSPTLSSTATGYSHWCAGCEEMHTIPVRGTAPDDTSPCWSFNQDFTRPTFVPSVNISWTDPDGEIPEERCHYTITLGLITYWPDTTHALRGQTLPLPELPEELSDAHQVPGPA